MALDDLGLFRAKTLDIVGDDVMPWYCTRSHRPRLVAASRTRTTTTTSTLTQKPELDRDPSGPENEVKRTAGDVIRDVCRVSVTTACFAEGRSAGTTPSNRKTHVKRLPHQTHMVFIRGYTGIGSRTSSCELVSFANVAQEKMSTTARTVQSFNPQIRTEGMGIGLSSGDVKRAHGGVSFRVR